MLFFVIHKICILSNKVILKKIFEKYPNIKFQENPSGRSRVIHADGWTNGKTDTKKLIVGFRNFASEIEKLIANPANIS
jgi:hypothetical protein